MALKSVTRSLKPGYRGPTKRLLQLKITYSIHSAMSTQLTLYLYQEGRLRSFQSQWSQNKSLVGTQHKYYCCLDQENFQSDNLKCKHSTQCSIKVGRKDQSDEDILWIIFRVRAWEWKKHTAISTRCSFSWCCSFPRWTWCADSWIHCISEWALKAFFTVVTVWGIEESSFRTIYLKELKV